MKISLIFLAMLAASAAGAAPIDMATQTCQDLVDADDDQQDQMIAWLHGYVSGHSGSTLYDLDARADAATLRTYCQNHLTIGVLSAAGQWKH